jgi:hypothetical protein
LDDRAFCAFTAAYWRTPACPAGGQRSRISRDSVSRTTLFHRPQFSNGEDAALALVKFMVVFATSAGHFDGPARILSVIQAFRARLPPLQTRMMRLYARICAELRGPPRALLDDIPACAITLDPEGDPDVDYC